MGLRWSHLDAGLQAGLINSVSSNAGKFNAQEISNTLLALSRLRINNDDILENLINKIIMLHSLSSIEIKSSLIGFNLD